MSNVKPRNVKPPMRLLPYRPLRAIVGALHDGAAKYKENNWREPSDDTREVYTSAAMRHLMAFAEPDCDDVADDSGIHHLANAGACIVILLYHEGIDYVESKAVKEKHENRHRRVAVRRQR
jgi:hypothetical protein